MRHLLQTRLEINLSVVLCFVGFSRSLFLHQDWQSRDSVALKDHQSQLTHYCRAQFIGAPILLARQRPMVFELRRLKMADVVLFEVDPHPVDRSTELVALTFGVVIGHGQS